MTGFIAIAGLFTFMVIVLLARPFLGRPAREAPSHRAVNAAIYREHLSRLEADLTEGTLGREHHEQARGELRRRALEDLQREEATGALQLPWRTLSLLAIALPLAAAALYAMVGNPGALVPRSPTQAKAASAGPDVQRMVAALSARLQKDPSDLAGWAMLGRSYRTLGRWSEAEQAFERAGTALAQDAQSLAIFSEVAARNRGGRMAGKPAVLARQALDVDPENAQALWLFGKAFAEGGNEAEALAAWERLMTQLPPASDNARMVRQAMAELRAPR